MKRQLSIISIALLIVAATISCTKANLRSKIWCREICDNELGVSGVEKIMLESDSMLTIINNLKINYSDSTMNCRMAFTTSVSGKWRLENNSLKLEPEPSTFVCDTIAGSFSFDGPFAFKGASKLRESLYKALNDYYQGIYTDIKQNGPLDISNLEVSNDGILRGFNNGIVIEWHDDDSL